MLGMLIGALFAFRRFRAGTTDYSETLKFKEQLPSWVSPFESLVWITILLGMGAGMFATYIGLRRDMGLAREFTGATALYAVVGTMLVALPIAGLCANGVSWAIPPVRRANLKAMSGVEISLGSVNKGLLLFSAVSAPIGLVELGLALLEPWAR